jgi:hypothetical protein
MGYQSVTKLMKQMKHRKNPKNQSVLMSYQGGVKRKGSGMGREAAVGVCSHM